MADPNERNIQEEMMDCYQFGTVFADPSELVERIARAICQSRDINPDCLYQHNFEGEYPEDERREYADPFTGEPRVQLFHRAWRHSEPAARAVLALPELQALQAERQPISDNAVEQMVAALRLHAFDDCGERDMPTHIGNVAADMLAQVAAERDRLREVLVHISKLQDEKVQYAEREMLLILLDHKVGKARAALAATGEQP